VKKKKGRRDTEKYLFLVDDPPRPGEGKEGLHRLHTRKEKTPGGGEEGGGEEGLAALIRRKGASIIGERCSPFSNRIEGRGGEKKEETEVMEGLFYLAALQQAEKKEGSNASF